MSTVRPMKRATLVPLGVAAAVLISVAAVVMVMSGKQDAGASAPDGGVRSPEAYAPRTPVSAECPATFDAAAGATPATSRAEFVPAGAEGATLCRYFEPNAAGEYPLLATYELAGDPDELVAYFNGLPDFEAQIAPPEDPGEGTPIGTPCSMALTHTFHVVLHYRDSVHLLVTVNPPCESVRSDGDTRRLVGGIEGLVSHWGLTA